MGREMCQKKKGEAPRTDRGRKYDECSFCQFVSLSVHFVINAALSVSVSVPVPLWHFSLGEKHILWHNSRRPSRNSEICMQRVGAGVR